MTDIPSPDLHLMPLPDLQRVIDTLHTRYWSWIIEPETKRRLGLLSLLLEKLPHIDPSTWPLRFEFGGIYVNGIEALTDQKLPTPARIEYYEPKFDISTAADRFPRFKEEFIIFRDDAVAVVYKPPHLSSMPAKEQRHFSLKASIERQLGCSVHMPSRLDTSAQGLVAISIAPQAHAGLQRAFETRSVQKTYRLASVQESPWRDKRVTFRINQSPLHPVLRQASETEGQSAETLLTFSHQTPSHSTPLNVFTAKPITGRTHQIRVHAAASGIPIFGDNFYGGAIGPYLHLVSCSITFPHPITKAAVSVDLPRHLSPDWVWSSADEG